MAKLKPLAKLLILGMGAALIYGGYTQIYLKRQSISSTSGSANTAASPVTYTPVEGDQGILGRPLRVAINEWPGFVGGIYANQGLAPNKGCINWNKYNLLVEYHIYNDPVVMMQEYAAGRLDLVWSTIDTAATQLGGLKSSIPTKVFMQVDWSRGGDAIVARSNVRSIEDLKGKKVALITQSPSESLLQFALRNSALSASEQQGVIARMVSMDDPDKIVKAFANGSVDAIVTWEPAITSALSSTGDAKVVFSTETAGNIIGDVFMASTAFLNRHPEVAKAFAAGWYDGAFEARNNARASVSLMMGNMPSFKALGEDQTLETFTKVKLTDMSDNIKTFGLSGGAPLFNDIFTQANAWYSESVKTQVSAREAYDSRAMSGIYAELAPQDKKPAPLDEFSFSKPAKKKAASTTPTFTKRLTINFPTGSAELTESAKEVVATKVVPMLKLASNSFVSIEGNTDSTGSASINKVLSEARAASVRKYLVGLGFNGERFFVKGNGSSRPVANNATSAGRTLNRRTDIAVISN